MKKTLLGTSAIALAGVSAQSANAAEWDVNVGGFFNAYAVFTSEDDIAGNGDRDGFDILTNAEIIFRPTITLDNGIQFGAVVEMEAEADGSSQSGVVDESYLFVEGGFGRVEMGAQDSAFGTMGVCSPTQGPAGVCSGTLTGTFLGNFDGPLGTLAFDGTRGGFAGQLGGDAVRINYYTPRFAGFQVGASYARGTSRNDRFFEDRDAGLHDILSIGANYEGNFGAASVKFAGTYETASAPAGGDPDQFHLGAQVGFGGFTVGGGYAHYDSGGAAETDFFDLGVGYTTGPWGVSLGGSHTDVDNNYDLTQIALNGTYNLGPGVDAVAFIGYADVEVDGGGDFDGYVVGTGIQLGF